MAVHVTKPFATNIIIFVVAVVVVLVIRLVTFPFSAMKPGSAYPIVTHVASLAKVTGRASAVMALLHGVGTSPPRCRYKSPPCLHGRVSHIFDRNMFPTRKVDEKKSIQIDEVALSGCKLI